MSVEMFETEVVELAVRRVRTPEGAEKYGLPIGAIITPDAVAAAKAAGKDYSVPEDSKSGSKAGSHLDGTIAGKAAAEKNQPKPAAKPKLKIKIKKSSISGNKHFSVGKSKYTAPNGSRLIRPASQPGMAYVVTPDGEVHAFNEAGEIEIPKTLKSVFQNKFNSDFQGDENYNVEEFEVTSASASLSSLKVGAQLTDRRGIPQFKKVADDSWEHLDLGVKLKDADLQDVYDSGDLIPDSSDEDVAANEETFANTEATDFSEMSISEAKDALDGMKPGRKLTLKSADGVRIFTKQENGSWLAAGVQENGQPFQPTSSETLVWAKDLLQVGADDGANAPEAPKSRFSDSGGSDETPDSPVNSTLIAWSEGMVGLDIWNEESEHYIIPGEYEYSDVTTAEDIKNAQPGDKILVAYDPDFEEGSGLPHYEATDLVEKQKDGSWKNLSQVDSHPTEELLLTDVDPQDGVTRAGQLFTFGGNSTKAGDSSKSGVSRNKEVTDNGTEDGLAGGNAGTGGPGSVSEGVGSASGDDGSGDPGSDGSGVVLSGGYTPPLLNEGKPLDLDSRTQALKDQGIAVAELYELDAEGGAFDAFHSSISKLKENNPYHASVYVYPEGEYGEMRLFLNSDGTAGVALKGDEIVSVFVHPDSKDKGSARSLISQAVAQGGKRLDAYDTVLPKIYAKEGFVPVARTAWDDEYAPDGWDKALYSKYNGGSPDVVFMAYDPAAVDSDYDPNAGTLVASYDDGVELAKNYGAPEVSHPLISEQDKAKKIGNQAGSNEGGLYELTMPDGSKQRYYVKKAQTPDHGNNEALANALYAELGVNAPEVDHASDGNLYSKIVDGEQDMQSRLDDSEWLDKVRRDFAIDAWLSNRDVFGLTYDNILTDADGNPWRIDNGGALRYRAMGEKKNDFGPDVAELDVFRTGKKAKVFGPGMTQEQELDGAKRLQALTPERIQEMVAQHGMDQEMADTLIARRQYVLDQYGLADTSESSAELTEAQEQDKPVNGVLFDKKNPPQFDAGDEIHEVPAAGNVLISKKGFGDDEFTTTLPGGLEMPTSAAEVFAGPDSNKFYLVKKSTPEAAPEWQWDEGHKITSVEDMDQQKPGTKLAYEKKDGTFSYYLKLDNGSWLAPGGGVFAPSQLKTGIKGGKFTVHSIPETNAPDADAPDVPDFGYKDGDPIEKMAHVNAFPEGFELAMWDGDEWHSVFKQADGTWKSEPGSKWEDLTFHPGDMGDAIKNNSLSYVGPEEQESTDLDTQLWQGAPAMSKAQISDAVKSLEAHTSFHVSYGLKGLPDGHPLKDSDNQESLKVAALNKYPDLKAKPAVVKYLKDAAGIQDKDEINEPDDANAPKISIGSKDPKSTGVQGMDGGEFTQKEIQDAIDILEAFKGKNFKSELNKKGNALGTLNPNNIVGFDKDKTVTKQKLLDLLKTKLTRQELNVKHPKVKSLEELSGLPTGTVLRFTSLSYTKHYTKVGPNTWNGETSGSYSDSDMKAAVEAGQLRVESMPEVLPDYAKTPAAIQDKSVTDEEVEAFTAEDVPSSEVGTELVYADGNVILKVDDNQWAWHYGSTNDSSGNYVPEMAYYTGDDAKVMDLVNSGTVTLKKKDGPQFGSENPEILPGKYTTKNGKAYMVASADGTGVYVNGQGTVSKLTKAAVKKNFESGMSTYHGMPDNVPTPDGTKDKKSPKKVEDLADGTYFVGSPNNPKTQIYEVQGDNAVLFKPNTSLSGMTGTKVGQEPNQLWQEQAGFGASVRYSYGYVDGIYLGDATATKQKDGKWLLVSAKGDPIMEPQDTLPGNTWYSKITSHGVSDPVTVSKTKVNTVFSQGKLVDQYGMSVVPEGYTGAVHFFGSPTTVPALVEARAYMDTVTEENANQLTKNLKSLGVYFDSKLWQKWRSDQGLTEPGAVATIAALKKALDEQLQGVDTSIPESNAADLFEWNSMGEAKMPLEVASATYYNYDKVSQGNYIKAASAAIGGGKVIGLHLTKMDKYSRQSWIMNFKKGDFKALYDIEVEAAAAEGKAHAAGYLHPGYSSNAATNQISWGAAVDGEVSANTEVPGSWSDTMSLASAEEVNNYLIKAQMQNPTYLSMPEKRQWYQAHRGNSKDTVDQLSAMAALRKKNGEQELSDPPTWTNDVKPGKLYDQLFENEPTPFPPAQKWKAAQYSVTLSWAKDNLENPEFKAYLAEQGHTNHDPDNDKYLNEQLVADFFQMKHDEYQAELLKPVYKLDKKVGLGSHEVWFASDQFGKQYVFKPADSKNYAERLQMEAKAAELARMWGFSSAPAHIGEIEGKEGLIQDFVPSHSSFALDEDTYLDLSTLSDKQLAAVASEHVLDWMLDNDDTHPDNMLLKENGSIVGIDKGRAFYVYGNWPGLSGDSSAHTNFSERSDHQTLVYTLMYDDIRSGKISKEQAIAAYEGARKAAKRIEKSSDETIEKMVRDAVAGRTNWSVPDYMTHLNGKKPPTNADELVAAVLDRKHHLAEQIDEMWSKIFKDSGLGDLPEQPPTVFEEHISGWGEPDVLLKATEAKVWGAAPLHSSAGIVDGHTLLWAEEGAGGNTVHKGTFKVGGLTQEKILSFLQPKATMEGGGYKPSQQMYLYVGYEFPDTSDWKSKFTAAGKNITKNSVDKEYDPAIMFDFEQAAQDIELDLDHWSPDLAPVGGVDYVEFPSGKRVLPGYLPQYKMMLQHYQAQIDKVNTAKESGGTTNKEDFSLFQALAPKNSPRIFTSSEGETLTEMANGQWLSSKGTLSTELPFDPEQLPDGWSNNIAPKPEGSEVEYLLTKARGQLGELKTGGTKVEKDEFGSEGHIGQEYQIKLPTGEVITFRNSGTTSTEKSQRGLVNFRLAGDNAEASLARVQEQLELMGLDMSGASEENAELNYWRAMFGRVLGSTAGKDGPASVKGAWSKLVAKTTDIKGPGGETLGDHNIIEGIGLAMDDDSELTFWRELANEAWGEQKVQAWVSEGKHLPKFQHMDLSDPTKATGKPYYERIDVDVDALHKAGHLIAIGNSGKDSSLLKYLTSGGMLSTEERLRVLGYFKNGASSTADQGTGGAAGVFTRIAHTGSTSEFQGSIFGQHVAYWSPRVMAQVGTYSFNSDNYGNTSYLANENKLDPIKSLKEYSSTSNETLVQHSMSIFDYLEVMVFEEATSRNEAIQRMKELGLSELRGLPIEDRFVMRVDLKTALAKVKAQWTK